MAGTKWSEKKIDDMRSKGYGQGELSHYKPWLTVQDFSSRGRARRVWSPKTGREHHLFSDVEFNLFLLLEWQIDFIDIREQFPLERALTQDIARMLGIAHPTYPGTNIPTVMTADFLVTCAQGFEKTLKAFNAKTADEANDERAIMKLEIQREYFSQMGFQHHLVFDVDIPRRNAANISDIREAPLRPGESEPRVGYFAHMCQRMLYDMPSAPQRQSLLAYCSEFDARFGCEAGTGNRVARILMFRRELLGDLCSPDLISEPLFRFSLRNPADITRAVGAM